MDRNDREYIDLEQLKHEAFKERNRREDIKNRVTARGGGFWEFCKYMDGKFFYDKKFVLKEVAGLLEKVFYRFIKMLIISIQPRTGKSYLVTMFCAWALGMRPDGSIMRITNTQFLSSKLSRDVKKIISCKKYTDIFDVKMSTDRFGDEGWALNTAREYSYFCAGIDGPMTGLGADIAAIIDDHVKNMKQASSKVIMDSHFDWYSSTFETRCEDDCPQILIGTRWIEDDIIGRILETEKDKIASGEIVNVVYKALTDDGKSFCEEIKSTEQLVEIREKLKRRGKNYIWDAVYQQDARPSANVLFKPKDLKFLPPDIVPIGRRAVIGYADLADTGDDFFAAGIFYYIEGGVYLYDVIYTKEPIEITCERVKDQILQYEPIEYTAESNFEGRSFLLLAKELVINYNKENLENKILPRMSWKKNTTNKQTRIMINAGNIKNLIHFRSDYAEIPEYHNFIKDLTRYDKTKIKQVDDAPDLLAGAAVKLHFGSSVGVESF